MRIHKVIFRLDFGKPNFDILDKPGTVMRLIDEMGEGYWPEFQESPQERIVSAVKKENGNFEQLSITPISLNFSYESKLGIEFNRIESDEIFTSLFKGAHRFCDFFKISNIARAGLRFTCLSSLGADNPDLNPTFQSLFPKSLFDAAENNLGKIRDLGFRFDGDSEDKTKFHLQFGPYADTEFNRHFQHEEHSELLSNVILDIDVFEESFVLTVKPAVWARAIIAKAQATTADIEEVLTKQLG